jgi:hypothetical protein
LNLALDVSGRARRAAQIFKLIVVRLKLVVGDAPVLNRHVFRQEARAVTFGQMRARQEITWQKTEGLGVPMQATAADAVAEHEGAPVANRQRRLTGIVAEGHCRLRRPQKKLMLQAIPPFILRVGNGKVARGVPPWAAFDGDDVQSGIGELVRENRAGPSQADDDRILAWKPARRMKSLQKYERPGAALSKSSLRPVRMIVDTDNRQRDGLVVAIDPVAIVVMRTRKSDHLPGGHIFVAAIDRIGKKAALRVLEDLGEEGFAVVAVELERSVLKPLDHVVLLLIGQRGKSCC